MSKELAKTYDPKGLEDRLYQKWLDKGYFHATVNPNKKPFTIMMPPPNVTGQLHMGHALDNTMQDILCRFKRMEGYEVLWQPGTDHAAIATEVKVTNMLKEQGIDKDEIGREKFLEHCWEWKKEYGGRINSQLRKIGSSADWERERFTMDEGCSKAVEEVFCRLYEKGWIYKGSRIINWCPVCQTSISDAEVEYQEQAGHFWHINYPVVGEEGRFVEIATTRPETLLGDTAVAVNPEDERYTDIVGKMLKLPLTDREIPVIADAYVDKEFGTGCVKITPAHDPNDFEVGKRHNLEEINILNDDGTMNNKCGKYAGMDRYEARKAMVEDLEKLGLLVKVVDHVHNVGTHDRCKTTVEPMIKPQWFVKMADMAAAASEAEKNGEVNFMELANAPAVAKYEADPNFTVVKYPEGRVNYLAVNKFCETVQDPKVVEAVFAALNRDEIIAGAYGDGMAESANSIFSNVNTFYDPSVEGYTQDVEKAKQLVKETGLDSKTLTLYFNSERVYMKESAQIIQQQLKNVGINLEVIPLESAGFFEKVFGTDGDYEFYLNGYGAVGDPDQVVAGMYDGTWGVNLAVSDEVSQLWKDARTVYTPEERAAIYKQIQIQTRDELTCYPIAYPNYVFVTTSNIKGADTIKRTPVFEDYTKLTME